MPRVLAVAVLCISAPALAQETAPAEPPSWSVGATVAYTGYWYGSSFGNVYSSYDPQSAAIGAGLSSFRVAEPRAGFFVERRLSRRTWLLLDATGSYSAESYGGTSNDLSAEAAAVLLGLRHVVSEGGIVDASVWAGLGVGWLQNNGIQAYDPVRGWSNWKVTASGAFLTGGIAVERKLLDALAIRLNLAVVRASYIRSRAETEGVPSRQGHGLDATLGIDPTLQVRLAF